MFEFYIYKKACKIIGYSRKEDVVKDSVFDVSKLLRAEKIIQSI